MEDPMTRLPEPNRDSLPPDAQAVWDRISGPRGSVRGPYAMLMHNPKLADAVQTLGTYLRFEGTLSGAERELCILATGREMGAAYEWVAHEPIARREGTRPEAIAAVRANGPLDALTERERTVVEIVRGLYRDRAISDEVFARARTLWSDAQLVELMTLAGFYGMIADVLLGCEVDLPPGAAPPF
jgi:4-carboxymuconolactone decarboxylase